jgi:hypothetical protein
VREPCQLAFCRNSTRTAKVARCPSWRSAAGGDAAVRSGGAPKDRTAERTGGNAYRPAGLHPQQELHGAAEGDPLRPVRVVQPPAQHMLVIAVHTNHRGPVGVAPLLHWHPVLTSPFI